MRQAIAGIDPGLPLSRIKMLEELSRAVLRDRGAYLSGLGVLASVATLPCSPRDLRSDEVFRGAADARNGVRVALGAGGPRGIAHVGARAVILTASGLAAGFAGSLSLTRLLASQLWGITPTDPATFAGVSAFLAAVARAACWVPARSAIQIDRAVTLRTE